MTSNFYNLLGQQNQNTQFNAMQNAATMRNIQLSTLRQQYPETVLIKQTMNSLTYRVPLMIPISPNAPLYIGITMGMQFPQVRPQIHILTPVVQKNIDSTTIEYIGPVI